MFNAINFAFSSTLFYKFTLPNATNKLDEAQILSHIFFISFSMFIAFFLFHFFKTGTNSTKYGEFKNEFKENYVCRMYVPFSIIFRIVLSCMLVYNVQNIYGTLFVLFVSIGFVMFNLINLPFASALHNYRATCIHLTEIIILISANYYRSMKVNTILPIKAHIHWPALLVIAFLGISTFLSLSVSLYEIIKRIRKCNAKEQTKPTTK